MATAARATLLHRVRSLTYQLYDERAGIGTKLSFESGRVRVTLNKAHASPHLVLLVMAILTGAPLTLFLVREGEPRAMFAAVVIATISIAYSSRAMATIRDIVSSAKVIYRCGSKVYSKTNDATPIRVIGIIVRENVFRFSDDPELIQTYLVPADGEYHGILVHQCVSCVRAWEEECSVATHIAEMLSLPVIVDRDGCQNIVVRPNEC